MIRKCRQQVLEHTKGERLLDGKHQRVILLTKYQWCNLGAKSGNIM